jgi:hypothetical protein
VWHQQRLYHVQAIGPEDFVKGAEARAFFDSFELTNSEPTTISIPPDDPKVSATIPPLPVEPSAASTIDPKSAAAHPEIARLIANAESRLALTQAQFAAGIAAPYEVRDAEAAVFEARIRLAQMEQNVSAHDQLLTGLIETRAAQLRIIRVRYEAGASTAQEVNAVENKLLDAQLRRKEFRAAHAGFFPVSAAEPANSP